MITSDQVTFYSEINSNKVEADYLTLCCLSATNSASGSGLAVSGRKYKTGFAGI
jgi:hypothetical protein